MARRYEQPCSVACALDAIGERWALLIVRELCLGPLRFSELARSVGGAPTDVLTKRLRDLEESGLVRRVELEAPASGTAYELTELGRGVERPLIELGRWGMGLQTAERVAELEPTSLPNALRVILVPPQSVRMTIALRSGGRQYELRIEDGWIEARRGRAERADVSIAGEPWDVLAAIVAAQEGAEVEGDPGALEELRAMVSVPEPLRAEALERLGQAAAI
jgi:DNA-binding HxlR family transcriptional regulator